MSRFKKQVPEGVSDILPQECYLKRKVENSLLESFISNGFEEVQTPAYEYYDVFSSGAGAYLQEHMIKFFDLKNRILVLRPDITVPIARLCATKIYDGKTPERLCYIQNAYGIQAQAAGTTGEFTQAGVEIIGEQSAYADAEVIAVAIKSLLNAGLSYFTIDIGQVGFFKGLIRNEAISPHTMDRIRHLTDIKNMLELKEFLADTDISKETAKKLTRLPSLFGGEEVFKKALQLCSDPACSEAVDNIQEVYSLLCAYGLKEYIAMDFGMLLDIDYYTGIVLRGLTEGMGFPVLSGGRYDKLLGGFGADAGATGFAIDLKRVLVTLESQGRLNGYYDTYAVVSADKASAKKAYDYSEKLRRKGKRVVFSPGIDKEKLDWLKQKYNAAKAVYFKKDGTEER